MASTLYGGEIALEVARVVRIADLNSALLNTILVLARRYAEEGMRRRG